MCTPLQDLVVNDGHVFFVGFRDFGLLFWGQTHVFRHVGVGIGKAAFLRPPVVKVHAGDQRRGALVVEDVIVAKPFEESLVVDDGGGRVVPHVKPAGHAFAAVAIGRRTIAVAVRVAGALLLVVVEVGTYGRVVVVVALLAVVRAFRFELHVPEYEYEYEYVYEHEVCGMSMSMIKSTSLCRQDLPGFYARTCTTGMPTWSPCTPTPFGPASQKWTFPPAFEGLPRRSSAAFLINQSINQSINQVIEELGFGK